jgi:DNA-binding NarL/FixJ family response regulator
VAISSRYPVIAEGLRSLLGEHPDRVTVVEVPAQLDELDAEVVLYDAIGLHVGLSTDLDTFVKETAAAVLIVGHDLRPELTSKALDRGADGFFSLDVSSRELLSGVESAATGWRPGDDGPNPTVGSGASAAHDARLGADVSLSAREVEILRLITQGRSNLQIADDLYLSINSIKTYIRSAYQKMGVKTRAQAVAWALGNGFTSDRDAWHPTRDVDSAS